VVLLVGWSFFKVAEINVLALHVYVFLNVVVVNERK